MKEKDIPFTIASASIKENIDFFIESFGLDRWIKPEDIVYDDGTYENKIAMFHKAADVIGIDMKDSDVSLRTNLVTLSDKGEPFADKVIEDYCADDISTEEARQLIEAVQAAFGGGEYDFYTGVSYRHCLIWHGGTTELGNMTPPHDHYRQGNWPPISPPQRRRALCWK